MWRLSFFLPALGPSIRRTFILFLDPNAKAINKSHPIINKYKPCPVAWLLLQLDPPNSLIFGKVNRQS